MNKFEIAELINNLKNRVEELESRFKIDNCSVYYELFIENTKLALGIDDEVKPKMSSSQLNKTGGSEQNKV